MAWKKIFTESNHGSTGDPHSQYALDSDLSSYAPLASPTFTGTVTIPLGTMTDSLHIEDNELYFAARGSAPATPDAGDVVVYSEGGDTLVMKDDQGVEHTLNGTDTDSFLGLSDTPNGWLSADTTHLVRVNTTYDGLEYVRLGDMTSYASGLNGSDLLLFEDVSATTPKPESITLNHLFDNMALAKAYSGAQTLQLRTDADSPINIVEFGAQSGGPATQDTILDIRIDDGASGDESLFKVRGSLTAPGVYVGDYPLTINDQIEFKEKASGDTPPSGHHAIFADTDGKCYLIDDTGTTTEIGGGSATISGDFNRVDGSYIWNNLFDPGGDIEGDYDPSSTSVMGFGEALGNAKRPFVYFAGVESENKKRKFGIMFMIPDGYDATSNTLKVSIRARGDPEGVGGSQIDMFVYEAVSDGATAGSDLCTTSVTDLTSSWVDYDFAVTDTALAAGDHLWVGVQTLENNTDGGPPVANTQIEVDSMWLTVG